MKVLTGLCAALSALLFMPGSPYAGPLDLSAFTAQEWVDADLASGTVTFTEDMIYDRGYLYNESFPVGGDAAFLSFDYSLTYGPDDYDDYFVCEIDYSRVLLVPGPASGRARIDLAPYRGRSVALDWGLLWGGSDSAAGTVARISAIEVEDAGQSANIPVPGTVALLLTGLTVLLFLERRGRE